MKKRALSRTLVFFALLMAMALMRPVSPEGAVTFPTPRGAVNDFAGVIPSQYVGPMESLAREVLEKTGTAIVVATVETIGDNDPNDYANRLYQAWGIGKKGEDKGVLIFLAVKERRVRIETGYGVEGILPDGLVGEILDRYALPYFKEGQLRQGPVRNDGRGLLGRGEGRGRDPHGGPPTGAAAGREPKREPGIFQLLLLLAAALLSPRHPPGQGDAPLAPPAADERVGRQARRGRIRGLRRRRIRGLRRRIERRRRGEPRILNGGRQMAKVPKKPDGDICGDHR